MLSLDKGFLSISAPSRFEEGARRTGAAEDSNRAKEIDPVSFQLFRFFPAFTVEHFDGRYQKFFPSQVYLHDRSGF